MEVWCWRYFAELSVSKQIFVSFVAVVAAAAVVIVGQLVVAADETEPVAWDTDDAVDTFGIGPRAVV